MTELLKLADAYYAVAHDLMMQGEWALSTAKKIGGIADRMCEQNMRETAAIPCKIMEYDGAYKCVTHGKQWGAISPVDEPCAGWVKP